ncbi:MAG: hypothetical protein CL676_13845 [Bdellovibrionaceae bacterium]|nr:hypothetical protein [Pseudobdellovibrionaceae bacterium]|tara:strand:+ start:30437 stop:31687 length:1251 start_codon:yes stop_codon:yes gene_type:complete
MTFANSLLLVVFLCGSFANAENSSPQKIGLKEIHEHVSEALKLKELEQAKISAVQFLSKDQSSYSNPTISYGVGSLKYSGGAGTAETEEFSISQKFPLNGRTGTLKEVGKIKAEVVRLQSTEENIKTLSLAVLSGLRAFISTKKAAHLEERKEYLKLISQFLSTKKFASPKSRLEAELIKNKIEALQLESLNLLTEKSAAEKIFEGFMGPLNERQLDVHFPDKQQILNLLEKMRDLKPLAFKRSSLQLEATGKEKSLASRKWIPDLQIYYSINKEKYAQGDQNQVVGVGLELPLFNRGSNLTKSQQALETSMKVEAEVERHKVVAYEKNLRNEINTALNFIEVYTEENLKKKEQTMKMVTQNFKKGLLTAANFLEFEDQIHNIQNDRLEKYFTIYQNIFELTSIYGTENLIEEIPL